MLKGLGKQRGGILFLATAASNREHSALIGLFDFSHGANWNLVKYLSIQWIFISYLPWVRQHWHREQKDTTPPPRKWSILQWEWENGNQNYKIVTSLFRGKCGKLQEHRGKYPSQTWAKWRQGYQRRLLGRGGTLPSPQKETRIGQVEKGVMTFPARGTACGKFRKIWNFMLVQRQPYSLLYHGAGENRAQGHDTINIFYKGQWRSC